MNLWFISIYGPCDKEAWKDFFKKLDGLKSEKQGPWLLVGDFNITKEVSDRKEKCRAHKII